jgi:chemotaxis response regulator CheB
VSLRVLLATVDPVFAAVCARALAAEPLELAGAVAPSELLESARQLSPDLIVLDCDGEEAAALKVLASKVMLVSDAELVLVSAYLAPGSPGLSALLQSIPATFVQKPGGASSLGLIDEEGAPFAAALMAAQGGAAPPTTGGSSFDDGWEIEEGP